MTALLLRTSNNLSPSSLTPTFPALLLTTLLLLPSLSLLLLLLLLTPLSRLSVPLPVLLLPHGPRLIPAGDAVPARPDPRLVFVAAPHVALFQAGGLERAVLADGAVVRVGHVSFYAPRFKCVEGYG